MPETVRIADGNVTIEVVPERGAIVSALRVGELDVLYLDDATLADPTKNVRGGIPVLFPFAGKLDHDRFALTGTTMKQHGFGRNKPWTIAERGPAHVRLTLAADADTRAHWPYDFTAEQTVRVIPRGLQLELAIAAGAAPLPVSPGWHPYFRCAPADKPRVTVDNPAFVALADDHEPDFGMAAPLWGRTAVTIPGLGALRLSASPDLRHLQCWSQPGKPFVCVEPFFGPAGTVNTEHRAWVPANQARTFWMQIELG